MSAALARKPREMMLLGFAAACLLHADRAPPWCVAAAAAAVLWHVLHLTGRLALPGRWVRYGLISLLLAGVLLSFGTLNGLAAGVALLMTMGGLKLLEVRGPRDAVVVTTVALILVLAAGLDRQDLWRVPLYAGTGWLALGTIAALGSSAARASARLALRRSGVAMLAAIPFAVLAFVLVPRLPGALWSLQGGEQAQTGLTEEMSPGSISDLAISDAIAFRVRFEDAPPAPSERYWRGPVLHDFDGFTWRGRRAGAIAPDVEYLSAPLRYRVMLEPHGQAYLFALDTSASLTGRRYYRTFDGQLLAHVPVTSPLIYEAVSHLRSRNPGTLSASGRRLDTRLPEGRNPRSVALARTLRAQVQDDADYARLVMDYFGSNGFEYSLTPPLLNYNSVDDLLFNTRLGFCGHFASAFVTLMRAAGVPARVVTGYLGGSLNPVGGYYVVRQSDAHAWAEVWLNDQGWVRFDPTSMVAPERLQRGLSELLPGTRSATSALVHNTSWLRNLRDSWDAAGNWWQERIVGFNAGAQRSLLSRLGLGDIDYRGMALLLLAGAVLWGAALLGIARWRLPRARQDATGRLWEDFLALLGRHGLPIAAHEGPQAIRLRALRTWPGADRHILAFTQAYERLRFGRDADPVLLQSMRQELRALAQAIGTKAANGTSQASRPHHKLRRPR
jgi:transglutaminase-like putative cysteine protease